MVSSQDDMLFGIRLLNDEYSFFKLIFLEEKFIVMLDEKINQAKGVKKDEKV